MFKVLQELLLVFQRRKFGTALEAIVVQYCLVFGDVEEVEGGVDAFFDVLLLKAHFTHRSTKAVCKRAVFGKGVDGCRCEARDDVLVSCWAQGEKRSVHRCWDVVVVLLFW